MKHVKAYWASTREKSEYDKDLLQSHKYGLMVFAVGSAPLLFAYWNALYLTCYKRIFNFLASLCS